MRKGLSEEEHGRPVTAKAGTPSTVSIDSSWAFNIPLDSLAVDIVLLPTAGATAWEDTIRFDRELTAYEKQRGDSLVATTNNWEMILKNDDLAKSAINQIDEVYIPDWEAKLATLKKYNDFSKNTLKIFRENWGDNPRKYDTKYQLPYQYLLDLAAITEDTISLIEINIRIKEKTITAIKEKNVAMVVSAANDEDLSGLIIAWHEERFIELAKQKEQQQEYFAQLVNGSD